MKTKLMKGALLSLLAALSLQAAPAGAAITNGNLLQNPGAESGSCASSTSVNPIPNWTVVGNFSTVGYDANVTNDQVIGAAVNGDNCFFYGYNGDTSSASQTVGVANSAAEIDSGSAKATLSAYVGGFKDQGDNITVLAQPLNAGNAPIGAPIQIAPATPVERSNLTAMIGRATAVTVPSGTRSFQVSLNAARLFGSDSDGSADNIYLSLGPPMVTFKKTPMAETPDQGALFAFVGHAAGTFECSLDNGAFKSCQSGKDFGPVAPGDHSFQVRETLAGITGPPALYNWTVDLPKACVIKTARARVFVPNKGAKARLVVRYTSYAPADVSVSYRVAGKKGSTALGAVNTRFTKKGVFKLNKPLPPGAAAKVKAAKSFKVQFKLSDTPGTCDQYYKKRLTIPKKFSNQTVWFQSDSVFAPGT